MTQVLPLLKNAASIDEAARNAETAAAIAAEPEPAAEKNRSGKGMSCGLAGKPGWLRKVAIIPNDRVRARTILRGSL